MKVRRYEPAPPHVPGTVIIEAHSGLLPIVHVWLVHRAFAGTPWRATLWTYYAGTGNAATSIAKAIISLVEARATDRVNMPPLLQALGFSCTGELTRPDMNEGSLRPPQTGWGCVE